MASNVMSLTGFSRLHCLRSSAWGLQPPQSECALVWTGRRPKCTYYSGILLNMNFVKCFQSCSLVTTAQFASSLPAGALAPTITHTQYCTVFRHGSTSKTFAPSMSYISGIPISRSCSNSLNWRTTRLSEGNTGGMLDVSHSNSLDRQTICQIPLWWLFSYWPISMLDRFYVSWFHLFNWASIFAWEQCPD